MKKLAILGSGMFVNGRNSSNSGVIIPAIYEHLKLHPKTIELYFFYKSDRGLAANKKTIDYLGLIDICNVNHVKFSDIDVELDYLLSKYKIDSSIVSLPDHLHYEVCKILLNKKVNILVVKPFVLLKSQAEELSQMCYDKNLIGQIEFHKRWDISNRYLKSEYIKGSLGDILKIDVRYSQNKSMPLKYFKNWSKLTNVFSYLGVHYVDLIYWLSDYKPISVIAQSSSNLGTSNDENFVYSYDVLVTWAKKSKKFISNFSVNWSELDTSPATSLQYFYVLGTKSRINLDQTDRGIDHIDEVNGLKKINPYYVFDEKSNNILSFSGYGIESVKSFLTRIYERKNTNYPSFYDGIVSTSVLEAVDRSSKQNGTLIKVDI